MLSGEKILVTGAGGTVASPISEFLAKDNEVWGAARFGDPLRQAAVEAAGVRTVKVDLASGDLTALPTDFTYVLHFGWIRCSPSEFERAGLVNAQAAGRVIEHCRRAKGILVTSSHGVYSPNPDPWFAYKEDYYLGLSCTDALLEANAVLRMFNPTSSPAKLAVEAVSRYCSNLFNVPVILPRLNTAYGTARLFPSRFIRAVMAGETITLPGEHYPHTPIHTDDMCRHIAPLLDAAIVGGIVVNWGGDDVAEYQDYARLAAQWLGKEVRIEALSPEDYPPGSVADNQRRLAITGPCQVRFKEGFRRMFDLVMEAEASGYLASDDAARAQSYTGGRKS